MNPSDQAYFDNIVAKDPAWLRQDEIGFLNARRGYLTSEQKRVFSSVLVKDDGENTSEEKSKSQQKREAVQSKATRKAVLK